MEYHQHGYKIINLLDMKIIAKNSNLVFQKSKPLILLSTKHPEIQQNRVVVEYTRSSVGATNEQWKDIIVEVLYEIEGGATATTYHVFKKNTISDQLKLGTWNIGQKTESLDFSGYEVSLVYIDGRLSEDAVIKVNFYTHEA